VDYDRGTEEWYHQEIDQMVDELVEQYQQTAEVLKGALGEVDADFVDKIVDEMLTIPPHEAAAAKVMLHHLIPEYSPRVAMLVCYTIQSIFDSGFKDMTDDLEERDPETLEKYRQAHQHLDKNRVGEELKARQNRGAKNYKNVDVHGKAMKMADLGDLNVGSNLN
jgi:hypothetical protein